ncbi:hypothetical protein Q1695_015229 [Nippostrongylus brasiliensis]|nr:hypothetical protein Q1695_015229 [Nippostrongylus brasiliensis]
MTNYGDATTERSRAAEGVNETELARSSGGQLNDEVLLPAVNENTTKTGTFFSEVTTLCKLDLKDPLKLDAWNIRATYVRGDLLLCSLQRTPRSANP